MYEMGRLPDDARERALRLSWPSVDAPDSLFQRAQTLAYIQGVRDTEARLRANIAAAEEETTNAGYPSRADIDDALAGPLLRQLIELGDDYEGITSREFLFRLATLGAEAMLLLP